jgi:acetyl esterase
MRIAALLALTGWGLVILNARAEDTKPITPVEAIKKVNEKVTVEMQVKATKNRLEKRGEIYLDSEEDFRDEKNLGIVIVKAGAAKFKEAGVNDPAVHFKGKSIRVRGTVTIKDERPRIEVDDPKQIQVVNQDEKPKAQPKPKLPPPTFESVKYGPHERNVLDFWQAKSEQPTPVLVSIHGGGFVQGNKSVGPFVLKDCLESGISVAAINYRYSTQAIAPAPFHDGARAVQFLRSKAKEWNIDSQRFAATGGSAGAGISLWLGFHKDMADPKSDDPVLRRSTRLTCMFVFEGQTSYDPRFIRKLFPNKDIYKIGALQKLFDFNPNQLDALPAEKYKLFEECSPITHVTKNAPPVLLFYNNPIDAEITNQGIGIHHPLFGKALKEKMDALKIPCEVNAAGKRIDGGTPTRTIDFLKEHFGLKK